MTKTCLALVCLLLSSSSSAQKNAKKSAITLIYSNDVLGEIEPCGCRQNPTGGMLRKANFLQQFKNDHLLQLDAGDLLFSENNIPDALKKQSRRQAEFLIDAMNLIQHHLTVPGEKDFALGLDVFKKLKKRADFKFLAANLKCKDGADLFKASHIYQFPKLRVGVLGLVGENLSWPKELKTEPAIQTARNLVPPLRAKVDILIALTHQGLEKDRELAKKVSGIDIIIGGHSQSFLQTPVTVGMTTIYQSSYRNQSVGKIKLSKSREHDLVDLDEEFEVPQKKLSPVAKKMAALVSNFKTAIARLNKTEEQETKTTALKHTKEKSKFQTFVRCIHCHSNQFDFWRKTKHADALHPLSNKNQLSNLACLQCHTLGQSKKGGYKTLGEIVGLIDKKDRKISMDNLSFFLRQMNRAESLAQKIRFRQDDPKLMPLEKALGQISHTYAPVQCENCHQAAKDHPFSEGYSKKVENQVCAECHVQSRSPKWYKANGKPNWRVFSLKRMEIACPK